MNDELLFIYNDVQCIYYTTHFLPEQMLYRACLQEKVYNNNLRYESLCGVLVPQQHVTFTCRFPGHLRQIFFINICMTCTLCSKLLVMIQ